METTPKVRVPQVCFVSQLGLVGDGRQVPFFRRQCAEVGVASVRFNSNNISTRSEPVMSEGLHQSMQKKSWLPVVLVWVGSCLSSPGSHEYSSESEPSIKKLSQKSHTICKAHCGAPQHSRTTQPKKNTVISEPLGLLEILLKFFVVNVLWFPVFLIIHVTIPNSNTLQLASDWTYSGPIDPLKCEFKYHR